MPPRIIRREVNERRWFAGDRPYSVADYLPMKINEGDSDKLIMTRRLLTMPCIPWARELRGQDFTSERNNKRNNDNNKSNLSRDKGEEFVN